MNHIYDCVTGFTEKALVLELELVRSLFFQCVSILLEQTPQSVKAPYFVARFSQLELSVPIQTIIWKVIQGEGIRKAAPLPAGSQM